MVDVSNQHWNKDGSITIILNSIEEVEEFVECVNIWNKMCEDEEEDFKLRQVSRLVCLVFACRCIDF